MKARVVRAPWVLPGEGEAIADGAVALDTEGKVLAVGPAAQVLASHVGADVETLRAVLMPALVNAHTHLELSWLRGQVPGGAGFVPWVEALVAKRRAQDPDEARDAIERACDELVACGTAAVGDVGNTLEARAPLVERGIGGWHFHEVLGVAPDAGEANLRTALGAPEAPLPLRSAISPHALYTMHGSLVRRVVEAVRARGAPLSIHLLEHPAERAFLRDRSGPLGPSFARAHFDVSGIARGSSPLDVAASLGLLAPDLLAVHLTDARREELVRLADAGARAVLCPRSNLYIQTMLPPLYDVLAVGLRPALGTDSLASNSSLDVMAEAAALRARFTSVPTRTLVAMVSAWGADALGLPELGRLAPGCRPGVLAVTIEDPARVDDPFAHVLASAPAARRWLARPHGGSS